MNSGEYMKNKGFTLVEVLGVMIILTFLTFVISEIIINNINDTNIKLDKLTEDIILSSARDYVSKNPNNFARINGKSYCINYSTLVETGFINNEMLPSTTDLNIIENKQIKILYNGNLFEYSIPNECVNDVILPTISISENGSGKIFNANLSIIITTFDNSGSGLSSDNKYQYYVSTSQTETINGEWLNYTSGAPFTITASNGTKYLWIYPIKDNGGTVSGGKSDINTPYVIGTYNFDTTVPTITATPNSGNYTTSASVTLTIGNVGSSGLSDSNVYKYYLSTSNTDRVGGSWTDYTSGTAFNITGNNQTKYLWVYPVKNNAGTVSDGKSNVNTPYVIGTYRFSSEYTVTYSCNGGSGSMASSTHVTNTASALTKNACYKITAGTSGMVYYVNSWNTKSDGTGTSYTVDGTINRSTGDNITLYAIWSSLFSYTGSKNVIDDGSGNWRVKFLTSGTYTPNKATTIDVFLVGGGGGGSQYDATYGGGAGGGGGYTKTVKNITVSAGSTYSIVIGAGGGGATTRANSGGSTTAFGNTANGGQGAQVYTGGNGGSGGGSSWTDSTAAQIAGGSNGGNGASGSNSGGTGQGTTTREFGESSGTLYAGGGAGSQAYHDTVSGSGGSGGGGNTGKSGTANTGGGGGGSGSWPNAGVSNWSPGSGGSGIVVIRNAR